MKTEVKDFLADLITDDRRSADVLRRLLTSPASSWHSISELCAGNKDALESYRALTKGSQAEVMATWLPHPASPQDVCLVLFYHDDDMTSSRHLELLHDAPSGPRRAVAS